MLGIDERRHAAQLLGVGDDVERERRLARRLGPVDLGHPAAGDAADTGHRVQRDRPGGDRLDGDPGFLGAHAHDRALAVLPLDEGNRDVQRLLSLFTELCSHFSS